MTHKILVSAHCHTASLCTAFKVMFPDSLIQPASLSPHSGEAAVDLVKAHLPTADMWVTIRRTDLAEGLPLRVYEYPRVCFAAFHPDLTYARNAETQALTTYHYNSRIGVWAYQRGLSPRDAAKLFTRETFEALGYFSLWEPSIAALRNGFLAKGFKLEEFESFMDRNQRRGLFMHSINHPHIETVIDVARVIATKAGAAQELVDQDISAADPLSKDVWPVYDEIAHHYGLAGNYTWRIRGEDIVGLEAYLEHAFAGYARQGLSPGSIEIMEEPALLNESLTSRWDAIGKPVKRIGA